MSAYYNEHDPFAAAWLRELITDGLIAEGDVDERDIQTLDPADLKGYTQCHFFAGIGGWSLALRLAGWPDDRPVWTGSCPCQPFSSAGTQAGGDDPRHLWPAWYHLIRECRPPVVFGEQVESAMAHGWLDLVSDDLEREGYAVGAVGLPAASVGAPHIRQRLWFVAESESLRLGGGRIGNHDHAEGARENTTKRSDDWGATAAFGPTGVLAESHHARHARAGQESLHGERYRQGAQSGFDGRGDAGELADAQRGATERRRHNVGGATESLEGRTQERQRLWDDAGTGQFVEQLADTGSAQRQRGPGECRSIGEDAPERDEEAANDQRGGPTSAWDNLLWLPCRDGKARPTQPGLFPLAHGVSNRVGTLRGAGNAIVPQVAAAFIHAYQEVNA